MEIRPVQQPDLQTAWNLPRDCGWAHRVPGALALERQANVSQRATGAIDAATPMGFIRAITDGLPDGCVLMVVAVATERRRRQTGVAT